MDSIGLLRSRRLNAILGEIGNSEVDTANTHWQIWSFRPGPAFRQVERLFQIEHYGTVAHWRPDVLRAARRQIVGLELEWVDPEGRKDPWDLVFVKIAQGRLMSRAGFSAYSSLRAEDDPGDSELLAAVDLKELMAQAVFEAEEASAEAGAEGTPQVSKRPSRRRWWRFWEPRGDDRSRKR
ncbi:MAG: hypothetical protein RL885_21020 [Planctomycetota bacterium]